MTLWLKEGGSLGWMCIKLWKRERVFKSIPKCSHIEVKISNWYLGNWGKCTAKESLWTVGKTWVIVKKRGNRNSISQRVHWWFFFFFQFFPPLKSLFSFSHPPPPQPLQWYGLNFYISSGISISKQYLCQFSSYVLLFTKYLQS